MRDLLGLVGAFALPWLAGTLAIALVRRRSPARDWTTGMGYGWFAGVLLMVIELRALDLIGVRWTLLSVSLPMLLMAIALFVAIRKWPPSPALPLAGAELRTLATPMRVLYWVCLALIAIRVGNLALEIVLRPLLPWDAWSHWSTKARVWYEFGRLAPFVSSEAWFAATDPMRFVDMHPEYPATVPLLQVWANLWLGRWDESLMNAPWLATMVALGMAFFGQLRRAGLDAAKALLATYLLLSLPFLDIHVALAGTADIFVAAVYGLAAIALWQWVLERDRADLAIAAMMAVLCVTIKVEGVLWIATLIPPIVVTLHRRIGIALVATVGVAAALYLAFGPEALPLFGYVLRTRFNNVSLPLAQHLFVMDNWHLYWYGAIAIVVLCRRRLFRADMLPLTFNVLAAFGLVIVVYFFSSAAGGVDDESLVNRLPLQMIVALTFYLALLLERAPGPREASQTQPKAADAYT
jgi:hypothetical protein